MAKASAATNYNKTLVKIQKLANSSAKEIQEMVNSSNKTQMDFNSAESQKARDWQEAMSKKAHQMEVADLKKAGLNPVLSTGGSGAQSYTTSSASTDNDSGSSAIASMLSQELGAMSNMESARMSSEAQLQASAQQAKANRYAAQQSAAAQRYAADQSYKLGVYRANLDYQARSESNEVEKWKVKNATATTWAGIIDKNLRNSGIYKGLGKSGRQAVKNLLTSSSNRSSWTKYDSKIQNFVEGPKANLKKFTLTDQGRREARAALESAGFVADRQSENLYVRVVGFHDVKAIKPLLNYRSSRYRGNGGSFW